MQQTFLVLGKTGIRPRRIFGLELVLRNQNDHRTVHEQAILYPFRI